MRTLTFARRNRGRGSFAVLAAIAAAGWMSTASASAVGAAPAAGTAVHPNKIGELDCNGFSRIQRTVRPPLGCSDPRGIGEYRGRFHDNGHYVGHDEPDLRFLSAKPGSGDNVTWNERLGVDPAAAPTVTSPGSDVTHYAELTIAPWFSMALCNPQSFPLNPCTPQSDANAPAHACIVISPTPCTQATDGGGSSFLEVQFYPPGEAPFPDNISCDNAHWCASLHINDLECTFTGTCNPNCVEPTNFAFIQTNGVPTGPPSPQLSDSATFTPDAHTLLMNPGDRLRVHIFDARASGGGSALEVAVTDLTTRQTGFMQASAANGFMATDPNTCNGTPFSYQPEFSTASADNIVSWAALQVNISTEFEIGHFEPCSTVTGPSSFSIPPSFTDTYWEHCVGAYEKASSPDGKKSPETSDAMCFPQGDTHGGQAPPNVVTGCLDNFVQNGDLDFDGTPYWPDWPNSTTPNSFPSPFLEHAPTTVGGAGYPQFQFQTDAALSESTCTGPTGCAVPPPGARGAFYPYWTRRSACTWEFGNMTNGNTFGKFAQYGTNGFAMFGYPEIESALFPNTCT